MVDGVVVVDHTVNVLGRRTLKKKSNNEKVKRLKRKCMFKNINNQRNNKIEVVFGRRERESEKTLASITNRGPEHCGRRTIWRIKQLRN